MVTSPLFFGLLGVYHYDSTKRGEVILFYLKSLIIKGFLNLKFP